MVYVAIFNKISLRLTYDSTLGNFEDTYSVSFHIMKTTASITTIVLSLILFSCDHYTPRKAKTGQQIEQMPLNKAELEQQTAHSDWTQVKLDSQQLDYDQTNPTELIDEITLLPSDLNEISSLTINATTTYFENGKQLKNYLKLELIDKEVFDRKKNTAIHFITRDTTHIKKKDGIISLKCQSKAKTYIDKPLIRGEMQPYADDEIQIFDYVGQFEFLNQYLISGSYWEGVDYRMVDKITGEETQVFGELTYISPDTSHILCIYSNPYESTADLELYTLKNKKIKHVISVSFKHWMPTNESNGIFWSSDDYLYVSVNHSAAFWKPDGNLNDFHQYIRIKVL